MTIASVTAGTLITPAWGNSVADQLNKGVTISGSVTYDGLSSTGYGPLHSFPSTWASAPILVATVFQTTASANAGYYVKVINISASAFRFRHYQTDGFWDDGVTGTIYWIAHGTLA